VAVATRAAEEADMLPPVPSGRQRALTRLSVINAYLPKFAARSSVLGDFEAFSVLQSQSHTWSRYAPEPGGGVVEDHRRRPEPGDAVVVVGDTALAAPNRSAPRLGRVSVRAASSTSNNSNGGARRPPSRLSRLTALSGGIEADDPIQTPHLGDTASDRPLRGGRVRMDEQGPRAHAERRSLPAAVQRSSSGEPRRPRTRGLGGRDTEKASPPHGARPPPAAAVTPVAGAGAGTPHEECGQEPAPTRVASLNPDGGARAWKDAPGRTDAACGACVDVHRATEVSISPGGAGTLTVAKGTAAAAIDPTTRPACASEVSCSPISPSPARCTSSPSSTGSAAWRW
jgi:hypothetical protein